MRPQEKTVAAASAFVNVTANAMLFGSGFLLVLIFFGPPNLSIALPVILALALALIVSIMVDVFVNLTTSREPPMALPPSDVHLDSHRV